MREKAAQQCAVVLGAGVIGRSWAALLLRHGWSVDVVDPDPAIRALLEEEFGPIETPKTQLRLLDDISGVKAGPDVIFESLPENVEVKRAVFQQSKAIMEERTLFASSSSAIPISAFVDASKEASQALIAHPLNPPDAIEVIEIVPGPCTAGGVVQSAKRLLKSLGRRPIVLQKETTGFVANRLQWALLREMIALIGDGVVTPADADALVRDGLARRWVLEGPIRTLHLNRLSPMADYLRDIGDHVDEMIAAIANNDQTDWESLARIAAREDSALPATEISQNLETRNDNLKALGAFLSGNSS